MKWALMLLAAGLLQAQVADRFVPAEPENTRFFGALGQALRTNLQELLKADEDALVAPFERRAAADPRAGEAAGRFLFAGAETYRYQKEQRLRVLLERVARRLLAAQDTDGYLGTEARAGRWKMWDTTVHREVMNGLLAYARVTGDERAAAGARRAGELLMATFGPSKRDIIASSAQAGWAGTALLATFCELYRQTQNERFLAFAEYLLGAREQLQAPQAVDTLLGARARFWPGEYPAEVLVNLTGVLEFYRLRGEERFLTAAASARGELAGDERFTRLPAWVEFNWQLLRLTAAPVYARELTAAVAGGLTDGRLLALAPRFVAGLVADGVALVARCEASMLLPVAGRTIRLEMHGKEVRWVEGEGNYALWWLGGSGSPLVERRAWAAGATLALPE